MSKTAKPEKPAGKTVITAEEHNFRMTMDRIITWHTLSQNRSAQARDPVNLYDASESLRTILNDKRTQEFIKATFFKVPEPEKAEDPDADGTADDTTTAG